MAALDHSEIRDLVCESAISADAIYRLADRLYDESAENADIASMAILIKDSAARIESRLNVIVSRYEEDANTGRA